MYEEMEKEIRWEKVFGFLRDSEIQWNLDRLGDFSDSVLERSIPFVAEALHVMWSSFFEDVEGFWR